MGYYTGSGTVVSGGVDVALKESVYWYGQHNVYQRIVSKTTVKNGVSLQDAQKEDGSASLSDQTWQQGFPTFVSHGCKGSTKSTSYSQINGSNLYALTINEKTIQARDDSGWAPTGWRS